MDWAEKYRPMRLVDIIGNSASIHRMAIWGQSWTRHTKPLLLYGKPGTGKTSSAYALAHDINWEVIELNASDQRTAAVIERIAGGGSTTASLTGSVRKLIILDEADNLQGTADSGGARAILETIRNSRQPIILIATDLYGIAPEIRLRCEPVQFKAIPARSIAPQLRFICSAEKIECSEAAVRVIAESAEGDVRSAVNMLYASAIGRTRLDETEIHTSQKDERISIFSLIMALASKTSDDDLIRLSREVEETPETIEQWIEGNIHLIIGSENLDNAYRTLARADEYLGYTYRRQYYALWRYANALMLLGIADASAGKGVHARLLPPSRWQKMSGTRKAKALRLALLNRVAGMMQIPASTLREEYLRLFSMLVKQDPEGFTRELLLDAESLNFFIDDMAASKNIVKKAMLAVKEDEKYGEKMIPVPEKKVHETGAAQDSLPAKAPQKKKPPSNSQSSLF